MTWVWLSSAWKKKKQSFVNKRRDTEWEPLQTVIPRISLRSLEHQMSEDKPSAQILSRYHVISFNDVKL